MEDGLLKGAIFTQLLSAGVTFLTSVVVVALPGVVR